MKGLGPSPAAAPARAVAQELGKELVELGRAEIDIKKLRFGEARHELVHVCAGPRAQSKSITCPFTGVLECVVMQHCKTLQMRGPQPI